MGLEPKRHYTPSLHDTDATLRVVAPLSTKPASQTSKFFMYNLKESITFYDILIFIAKYLANWFSGFILK